MSDGAAPAVVFTTDISTNAAEKALIALSGSIQKLVEQAEARGKKLDETFAKVGDSADGAAKKAGGSASSLDSLFAQLTRNVSGLGESAVPSLGGVTSGLGRIVSAAGPAGLGIMAVVGGFVLLKGAAEAVVSAVESVVSVAIKLGEISAADFAAQRALAGALARTGDTSAETRDRMESLAVALSRATGIADESVTRGMATLIGFGRLSGDTLKRATADVMDWSRKTGQSVEDVAMSFVRGMNGMGRDWKMFGVEISRNASPVENLGHILQFVEQSAGGTAAAFSQTLPGAIEKCDSELDRLKRNLGDYIARSPSLIAGVTGFASALGAVTDGTKATQDVIKPLVVEVYDLAIGATRLGIAFHVSAEGIKEDAKTVERVMEWMPIFGAMLQTTRVALDLNSAASRGALDDAEKQSKFLQALIEGRRAVMAAQTALLAATSDAKGGPLGLGLSDEEAQKTKTHLEQIREKLAEVVAQWNQLRATAPDAAGTVAAAIREVVGEAASLSKEGVALPGDLMTAVTNDLVAKWIPKTNAELAKDENKLRIAVGLVVQTPLGQQYKFKMPSADELMAEFKRTMAPIMGGEGDLSPRTDQFDAILDLERQMESGSVGVERLSGTFETLIANLKTVPIASKAASVALASQKIGTDVLKESTSRLTDALYAQGAATIVAAIQGKTASGELFRAMMTQFASEAWVQALKNLAEGFACLAEHQPVEAALHWKAAAMWGLVGTAAAIAGGGGGGQASAASTTSSGVSETKTEQQAAPFEQTVHIYIDGQGFVQDFDTFARKIADATKKELTKAGRAQR